MLDSFETFFMQIIQLLKNTSANAFTVVNH